MEPREDLEIIRSYYDADPQAEWDRTGDGKVEVTITKRILEDRIQSGDRVLDIGGGPGRYAIWLAGKGCDVTLLDLSPANVAFAGKQAESAGVPLTALCGNAVDPGAYPVAVFDHVLVMGPMYHLFRDGDRKAVMDNAPARLRPGGRIYVSFINLFAGMMFYLDRFPEGLRGEIENDQSGYCRCVETGRSWQGTAFTQARFDSLADIRRFCGSFGLEPVALAGQEGFLGSHTGQIEALEEQHRDLWIDCAYRSCQREEYLSMSAHILYIGRKPS